MKKKGFTLIELLAVIVILAIIMVVAVPKIIDIIEETEKKAYEESVELMAHTAQIQYKTDEVNGRAPLIPDTGIVYEFENGEYKTENKLKFKGDKPFSGTITLTKNKKVIIQKLVSKNKKWCAIKEEGEKKARVGRSTDPAFACIVEADKPIVDKKACELEVGKETINGEEKNVYYVDSPSDLYKLSKEVNEGNNYSGKIIKVRNNLDMSNVKNKCDSTTTSFKPIGTQSKPFSGTFDGGAKTISNLTINEPSMDNVGLFGYVSGGTIVGVSLNNIEVTGNNYTGGLVGLINGGTINEICIDNFKIAGFTVGGAIGGYAEGTAKNILVKTGTVQGTGGSSGHTGFISTTNHAQNSISEKVTLTGGYTRFPLDERKQNYASKLSTMDGMVPTYAFNSENIDDINFYEAAGLDTWIGGDNDSSGYYFDYDNNNKIVLKSTKEYPINTKLDGSGTESDPYKIKNASDWKKASAKTADESYFEITSDIDFSGSKFYMLGSNFNQNRMKINGKFHKISNVEINADRGNYIGLIGNLAGGELKELQLEKINIVGYDYTGIVGYSSGNISSISLNNINIKGYNYTGGLVGLVNTGTINEICIDNFKIAGFTVGGAIGRYAEGTAKNILVKTGTVEGTGGSSGHTGFISTVNYTQNSISEKVTLTGGYTRFPLDERKQNYASKLSTMDGMVPTYAFSQYYIGDLSYYTDKIETVNNGDANNTGYFFDYVESKGGIYLVKAYTPTPSSGGGSTGGTTPTAKPNCTCSGGCYCADNTGEAPSYNGTVATRCSVDCHLD